MTSFEFIKELESNPKEIYLETTRILLKILENIIQYPREDKYRTLKLTNSTVINKLLPVIGAMECLFAIGFSEGDDNLYLPHDASIANLTLIQNQISTRREEILKKLANESTIYNGCNINLTTQIPSPANSPIEMNLQHPGEIFLQQIENHFNFVLIYEREDLQNKALKIIPKEKLEQLAEKRLEQIKNADKNNKLKFHKQDFILIELLDWFKNSFFTWVDSPSCEFCKNNTKFSHNEKEDGERVEVFSCVRCKRMTRFPRINDPGKLLDTRRGRCGEWANCFTLCCRALGWDARRVVDINDHVWTEVYSISQRRWLHCDPCENICDSPLIYETGWNKPMRYVIAYSCYELQDVTWRYTCKHATTRSRRTLCDERVLLEKIMKLRAKRQEHLSKSKIDELNERLVNELVEFMTPRRPDDSDHRGRTSGSLAWRLGRDEAPDDAIHQPYCWVPTPAERLAGAMQIRYSCFRDVYIRPLDINKELSGWQNGVAKTDSVFRKEEKDWNVVYLTRKEGAEHGLVTWKFDLTSAGVVIDCVKIRCHSKIFNSAKVSWVLCSGNTCVRVPYDNSTFVSQDFHGLSQLTLSAHVSGSEGPNAWQHAQLFRTSTKNAPPKNLDEEETNCVRTVDGEDASPFQLDITLTLIPLGSGGSV